MSTILRYVVFFTQADLKLDVNIALVLVSLGFTLWAQYNIGIMIKRKDCFDSFRIKTL